MNANELAEWLENHVCGRETTKEVIAMLRQQQARVDELENALEKVKDAYCIKDSKVKELEFQLKIRNDLINHEREFSKKLWQQLNPLD